MLSQLVQTTNASLQKGGRSARKKKSYLKVDLLLHFFVGFNPDSTLNTSFQSQQRRWEETKVATYSKVISWSRWNGSWLKMAEVWARAPQNSWIAAKSAPFLNVRRKTQVPCPAQVSMKCTDGFCPGGVCCAWCNSLLFFISSDFFQDLIVHLSLCQSVSVLMKVGGPTYQGEADTVQVHIRSGAPVWPNVVCVCVGRGLVLAGAAGRAGVRRGAGLLLVLGGAVSLQGRHGGRGELTLGGAAFTGEQLAFDLPEVIAIVKSDGEDREKVSVDKQAPLDTLRCHRDA